VGARRRAARGGGAVVFATQNLEEVERVADRVAALRDGRLVFAGSVREYESSHVETLSALTPPRRVPRRCKPGAEARRLSP
jgi:ABC-type multidrug transport system ATPase subunit